MTTKRLPALPTPPPRIGGNLPPDGFVYETRADIPRDVPSMQWAPFDIPAILRVLREMPLDERGFFVTALFAMYEFMEPLPEDPAVARMRLGIDVRSYKHHLKQAIARGVLKTRPTGRISNARFEEEITRWVERNTAVTKSDARSRAASEREARKRVPPKIDTDLSENASTFNGGAPQGPNTLGRGDRVDIDPMSARSRGDVAAISSRSQADLAAMSARSRGDFFENVNEINASNHEAAHNASTTKAQAGVLDIESERDSERKNKNPHTHTSSLDSRESPPVGGGVCVAVPSVDQIAFPPVGRVTTPQADPRLAKPGEVEIAPHVFVSDTAIRHPNFSINLAALEMQLNLANQGWSGNDCKDLARKFACAHAVQWATEIANGKLSRDVLPAHIVNAIRASAVRQKQANDAGKAKLGDGKFKRSRY